MEQAMQIYRHRQVGGLMLYGLGFTVMMILDVALG